MRALITLLLFFLSTAALASTITLTWDVPTTRVNGDPLPASEISHYVLQCQAVRGTGSATMEIPGETVDGRFEGAMSDLFPNYGDYACEMSVVDTWGLSSDWVKVENGPVEYRPAAPGVPTNVLILVE